jgi:outer membrane lipoprotein LolB
MNKLFLILLLLLLSGCVSRLAPPSMPARAVPSESWILRGKMGIRTPDKTESASVYWRQQNDQYAIKLFGPLGIGAVELNGQPGKVIFIDNQGKHYQASSPEALLQQNLGWQLPAANLQYWVRALPAPGISAQKTYDQQHQLISLVQQGWKINYLAYRAKLPYIIELTRSTMSLRLVINQWQFYPPSIS